jgi:phage terminase small subunit
VPKPKPKRSSKVQEADRDENDKKLTEKERKFCNEYLIDLNASRAARDAGFSDESAAVTASRLLRKANVSHYISKKIRDQTEKLDIQRERIFRELKSIAFSRITNFMRVDHGRVLMLDTADIDRESIGAVAGYTETTTAEGGSISIKLHDKLKALDMLAKYAKLFKEEEDANSNKSDLERIRRDLTGSVLNSLRATCGHG